MDRIKAITFDFWGTLYHGMSSRLGRMQRLADVLWEHGLTFSQEALDEADRLAWTEWDRAWREEFRTLSASDWLRLMFEHLRVTLPPAAFEGLADDFDTSVLKTDPPLQLVDGVQSVVRRLAGRFSLGIISDTGLSSGKTLRRFLDRDRLAGCFACLSFSDETGVSKPHPDAFRRALACLAVQPSEAIHVGDLTRTDIAGAKSLGMFAVRFTGAYDDPDLSTPPDAIVQTYADFEQLVHAWTKES